MKKALLSLVTAASLSACGVGAKHPVDFKEGVPTNAMVKLSSPDTASSGSKLTGTERTPTLPGKTASVQGQVADLYVVTRVTTVLVNGTTAIILGVLRGTVEDRAATVTGEVAVYGPYTPTLSLITWRLTVTRTEGHIFSYALEGKIRDTDDASFTSVLTGSHTVALDADGNALHGDGHGTFQIDWQHSGKLSGLGQSTGSAQFAYAHDSATAPLTVAVTYDKVFDAAQTNAENAEYRYAEQPDGSGTFEFAADLNAQPWDVTKSALERWTIKSRWQPTGAGRSDVKLAGGDLTTPATLNECWDTSFDSTYVSRSYDIGYDYGTEATGCALTHADYSKL